MLQLEMQPQNVEVNSFIMVDSDKNVKLLKKINELNNNLSVAEIRKLNCKIDEIYKGRILSFIALLSLFMILSPFIKSDMLFFTSLGLFAIVVLGINLFFNKIQNETIKEKYDLIEKNKTIGQKMKEKVKKLREMNFFNTENKAVKKLKKELKRTNYWDDEFFKINEVDQIDFNFKKLIKSIKNSSKSTINNIQ